MTKSQIGALEAEKTAVNKWRGYMEKKLVDPNIQIRSTIRTVAPVANQFVYSLHHNWMSQLCRLNFHIDRNEVVPLPNIKYRIISRTDAH